MQMNSMNLNSQGPPPWACLSTGGRAKGWHIFKSCSLWCEGDNGEENTWGDGSSNPIFAVWLPERRILRPLPPLLAIRIPYEMLDLIVNHAPVIDVLSIAPYADPSLDRLITENRAALLRWALVCRTWHRRCIQYLYSSIAINRRAYDGLALSLNRSIGSLRQNLQSVRILYIRESDVKQFFRLVPRTLGTYLARLHTLHVEPGVIEEDAHFPLRLDSTFFALLPLLGAKVTSLALIYLTWRSASDFWRVIACFPNLQKLSVDLNNLHGALHWHNFFTSNNPYLRVSKRPDISDLYVDASTANETMLFKQFLQWLLISPLPIRSLSIHPPVCLMHMDTSGHDNQIFALYSRLFRSLSPTLQEVTVGLAIVHCCELKDSAVLRVVKYSGGTERATWRKCWEDIKHLLSQIRSRYIEEVAVSISLGSLIDMESELARLMSDEGKREREDITAMISNPYLKSLMRISLDISGTVVLPVESSEEQLASSVKSHFAALFSRWHQHGALTLRINIHQTIK